MNRNALIGLVVVLALVIVGLIIALVLQKPPADAPARAPEATLEETVPPAEQPAVSIAGVWQSTDDSRFVRTFRSDGTVTDRYEGEDALTVSGIWNFVDDPSREQAELPDVEGATYIKLQFPEEVLYFTVTELSASDLSLSYVGRGNTLSFERVD
ncbi:MAG: hypothetical protein V4644_00025 [Patescibacteria group bacterium]